jgi:nucleotide-binding universal stress UspA family protein
VTLVVGVHPTKDDRSVLELAAALARSSDQDLFIDIVVPAAWSSPLAARTDPAFETWADETGQRAVARVERTLAESFSDVTASAAWIAGRSIPGTLIEQAESSEAPLIIVGSGSAGPYGRIHVNSTAETLLHSSPIPVAVATRGHRGSTSRRIGRVTLAFRGDEASRRVLECTAALCADVQAPLRVVTFAVRGKTMYPPSVSLRSEDDITESWIQQSEDAQKEALAGLDTVPDDVECVVAQGTNWAEAIDALAWEAGDVLVVGSSQHRGMSRLFLGSTATKIARNSPVPVIVVP